MHNSDQTPKNTNPSGALKSSVVHQPLLLTIKEVCQLTSLGRTTICTAISLGDLPSIKIRRRRLILFDDLVAWIASYASRDNDAGTMQASLKAKAQQRTAVRS